jgi:predicted metal-dependent hydrolase
MRRTSLPAPEAVPLTAEGWPRNEDYLFGVDLFNAGYYWEAHTFWERLWTVANEGIEPGVRDFLQGLVQLAAACLKRRQGELSGARKLVTRAKASFRRAVSEADRAPLLGVDRSLVEREVERFVSSGEPAPRIELFEERKT